MTAKKSANRYLVLVLAVVSTLFLGTLYAWSLFIEPLETAFGWVRSQTSVVYSVSMVCFCVGSFLSGRLCRRLSPRTLLWAGAALVFLGFLCCSRVRSLWQFCLFYGVLCGMGIGISYQTWQSNVMALFWDRRGLASGLMTMGFGLSALLLGSLIALLLSSSMGWRRVFLLLSLVLPGILALTALFLERPQAVTAGESFGSPDGRPDLPPSEMMKTKVYWVYMAWLYLTSLTGVSLMGQCAAILTENGGSALLAAAAVGLLSLGNGFGRLLNGMIFDRFGKNAVLWLLPLCGVIASTAAWLFCREGLPYGLMAAFSVLGLSYGGTSSFLSVFISDTFGPKYLQQNHSTTALLMIPMFLTSNIAGYLRTETGSYTLFFLISILWSGLCLIPTSYLCRHPLPRR